MGKVRIVVQPPIGLNSNIFGAKTRMTRYWSCWNQREWRPEAMEEFDCNVIKSVINICQKVINGQECSENTFFCKDDRTWWRVRILIGNSHHKDILCLGVKNRKENAMQLLFKMRRLLNQEGVSGKNRRSVRGNS